MNGDMKATTLKHGVSAPPVFTEPSDPCCDDYNDSFHLRHFDFNLRIWCYVKGQGQYDHVTLVTSVPRHR